MLNKVTMQQIADQLNISKVTVSKALNNQPGVSEELKKEIVELSQKLGYTKNRNNKIKLDHKNLGFLVTKRHFLNMDKFYTVIYYHMTKICARNNVELFLYVISDTEENQFITPPAIATDNILGLFIAGEMNEGYLHALTGLGIPMVGIDFYQFKREMDFISIDNFYSGYAATMKLIEHNHKNIGFVGSPFYSTSIADRFYGYQKALALSGLSFHKEWHLVNNDFSNNYSVDFELPQEMPTAFVCHCDMAAYHLMLKLQSSGYSVPNDVSVISFDNTDLCEICHPKLTSVDIDKYELAVRAFEQMNERFQEPQNNIFKRIVLDIQIVERETVGSVL